jgi:FtsH-binding integral membrane protein
MWRAMLLFAGAAATIHGDCIRPAYDRRNKPVLKLTALRGGYSSFERGRSGSFRPQSTPFMSGDLDNDKMSDAERVFVVEQFKSQPEIRKQFVKRVYAILAAQLTATTGLAISIRANPALFMMLFKAQWLLVAVSFISMMWLALSAKARKQKPLNGLLLAAFTLGQATLVGLVTARFPAQLVIRAAGATALATGSLSSYAFTTKRDLTPMGMMLRSSLITLIGLSLLQYFFGGSLIELGRIYFGVLIFCGYIVYDTWTMMAGGKDRQVRPTEPILAAISLYTDIINLFLYLLQAMARNQE